MSLLQATTSLIVGGGPVGLTTALLLARQGFSAVVLEKYPKRLSQPKAHVFNPRTMEIFRQLGVDTTRLRAEVHSERTQIHFCTSISGTQFGTIEAELGSEHCPESFLNISQPKVENYLMEMASKTELITLLKGHEWLSCSEDEDGAIVSSVRIRESGEERTITSKYLVGCDGSHSKAREVLDIPFEPLDNQPEIPIHCVSAHFLADLTHLPEGILWFILNPGSGFSTFIAYDKAKEWVYAITYDPEVNPTDSWAEEVVRKRLEEAMGQKIDYELQSILPWTTYPKIAKTYRSNKVKNAFLAGDAAHAFPPTGGLGVNTGIADAQNLAWKIKAVEEGWASHSFLDTVTAERKPIADANSRQSKLNEEMMVATVGKIFRNLGESGSSEQLIQDPQKKKLVEEAIADNSAHFSSLNLQIGYAYGTPPLSRAPHDYRRENVPGVRLPHAWIEANGVRQTTLDLVDGSGFVLLTSDGFSGESAVNGSGKNGPVPICTYELGKDFVTDDKAWGELMGLHEKGAGVVVRPDQHIIGSVKSFQEARDLLEHYLER
ncbi:hypothetical protein K458DRAFT_287304 [Lentithecium fluviatile CBS 122367]|uniref:FAD-binding domain-containing protein n=1 Tax=Lentithecium fluviatile CBS 122367 TaxID=1168545 RepID=A0A6G1JKY6_9PLEO|nr:hypothetical protein K458DRAFT_287304 [Lentithecium fluviatile CBS 122367]